MTETEQTKPATDESTKHGVHPAAAKEESKGLPHSDREKSETAAVNKD
jgi:hypothetical protein